MPEWISEVVNLGFAVFVAIFLLTKFKDTLEDLKDAINNFSQVVNELQEITNTNVETTEKQTEILIDHDIKLDDLKKEVEKIPKRGEE